MTNTPIIKPTIFISHATTDAEFANAVKQELAKVFADGVTVFCTSSPGTIGFGEDWLAVVERNLAIAKAIVAIVTPVSIERPWLWFELGATWSKGRTGDCRIYPLCAKEVDVSDVPPPLDRLQALSMGKSADLRLLFQQLIDQFGFGRLASFRPTNITNRIPKYKDVKVKEEDLNQRTLYSGRYTGYADEELREVIDTEVFYADTPTGLGALLEESAGDRESRIRNGKLIHFRELDRRLQLPPGTSRRLLNSVAERYGLAPDFETENLVRYRRRSGPRKQPRKLRT
jgi:hypothetical protein